ncbi:MAG TPA: methyltransferase [Acidimicrobiia bacterium]|nr:methyltransferase [Acidimicrobiia bacterium]
MAARVPPAWVIRPLLALRNGVGRLHRGMVPPDVSVFERALGIIDTKAMVVAADLGVADALTAGPRHATEIAAEVGADADALERLLRYLVGRGVFRRRRDGRFANNGTSNRLRVDHPTSLRPWVRFFGAPWHVAIWNELEHSVRTGDGAAAKAFGHEFWDYVTREDPAAGRVFDEAMEAASRVQLDAVTRRYDWPEGGRICDVGGGTGTLLAAIVASDPSHRGVLFDLPEVVAKADTVLAAAGVADRIEVVGGDFFAGVPAGCDRYVLQAIVHDWDDDSCVRLLTRCREALPGDGRVLVLEFVMPDHDGDAIVKATDLEMLVDTGKGRERTRSEFVSLFTQAGLRVVGVTRIALTHVFELEPTTPV